MNQKQEKKLRRERRKYLNDNKDFVMQDVMYTILAAPFWKRFKFAIVIIRGKHK